MIVPIPSGVVDVLVVINLALSLGVMCSVCTSPAGDFSISPLLLVLTLFRLGLISASAADLIDGNAGDVVKVFGNWFGGICSGRGHLLNADDHPICCYHNGAGVWLSISRFTLDAMPGKRCPSMLI